MVESFKFACMEHPDSPPTYKRTENDGAERCCSVCQKLLSKIPIEEWKAMVAAREKLGQQLKSSDLEKNAKVVIEFLISIGISNKMDIQKTLGKGYRMLRKGNLG